jgi:hypothetical protein
VILQGDSKIVTERFHALVTIADPFAAELTNELGVLSKTKRKYATPGTLSGFENRYLPSRFLKRMRGREPRETRTDNDARIRAARNKRAE